MPPAHLQSRGSRVGTVAMGTPLTGFFTTMDVKCASDIFTILLKNGSWKSPSEANFR